MLSIRILLFYTIWSCSIATCLSRLSRLRSRSCTSPEYNPHTIYNRRGTYLYVNCYVGYKLIGHRVIECLNNKWIDPKPVCAKKGCLNDFEQPDNGQIIVKEYETEIICADNYMLAGNRVAYCNGTHWDRPIGECRLKSEKPKHECDFETEDLCGWFAEPVESHQWKRKIAINVFGSLYTGPTHDHTTMSANGGHYMIMESLKQEGFNVPLISPIYDKILTLNSACCFRFYYFMYGQGVGELSVYIKPASLSWELLLDNSKYLKFKRSGTQEMAWKEEIFNIPEMPEHFQIVFVAKSSRSHLSDIAIDDIKLMIGSDCFNQTTTTVSQDSTDELEETTPRDVAVYESESCQNRCFQVFESGLKNINGKLYLLCSCHLGCGSTCCPDFRTECLGSLLDPLSPILNISWPTVTTTLATTTTPMTTLKTTTTTTTTTTTPKPTTTTSITTTTPKPSTTTTTTTTTTTVKPTTMTTKTTSTSTTTSTTTTKKPTTTTTTRTTSPSTRDTSTTTTTTQATNVTSSKKASALKPIIMEKKSWKYEPQKEQKGLEKHQILEIVLVLVVLGVILVCIVSSTKHNLKHIYKNWRERKVEINSETAEYNKNADGVNKASVRLFKWQNKNENSMNVPLVEVEADDGYL